VFPFPEFPIIYLDEVVALDSASVEDVPGSDDVHVRDGYAYAAQRSPLEGRTGEPEGAERAFWASPGAVLVFHSD